MKDLIEQLLPHMGDGSDRRALVESTLYNCGVLPLIDWRGNAYTFTVNLVRTLLNYGECEIGRPSIVMLLEGLKEQVGTNQHVQIDALVHKYSPIKTQGEPSMLPPDLITMSVPFLFEIGRWAKTELSEIWKLRRKEKEVELSKQETQVDKSVAKDIIEDATTDYGDDYVKRVLDQVQKKRDLYLGQIQRIDAARDQRRMGELTEDMLNAQMEHASNQKKQLLKESRELLESLGLTAD